MPKSRKRPPEGEPQGSPPAASPTRKRTPKDDGAAKPRRSKEERGKSPAARPKTKGKNKGSSGQSARGWRRWLALEALTWGAGAAIGALAIGALLWSEAVEDVEGWRQAPPPATPSVLYSAPMRPRAGIATTPAELAGELLSAGYEKVDALSATDQFSVKGDRFEIWTANATFHGVEVKEQLVTLTLAGGRMATLDPKDAVLRPATLATIGDPGARRHPVQLKDLSPWMEPALLAMEDARFREHRGIDPIGILRALGHNALTQGGMHGGSTLTQQLAKNLFLSPDRTVQRKIKEAFLAAALETRLSKDELLSLYLSEVYLGQAGGVPLHGVEAAARAWFGISASSLSLGQAATIAGVISAPNRYSPLRYPERAKERRDLVLRRMVETKAISTEKASEGEDSPLTIGGHLPGAVRRAPWAVDAAVEQAEHALADGAMSTWGYQIYTTIQPFAQRAAEAAVRDGLAEIRAKSPQIHGIQAALVAVSPQDGAVLALVGGESYAASPFNRATSAWRQAGSTVKPLTLLAALHADPALTPLSALRDEPITRKVDGKSWTPANYDGGFMGDIPLRVAIEKSRNIPAILLAERVGPAALQRFARDAGLSRATQLPAAALGAYETTAWELAGSYTAFPGQGVASEPHLLRVMVDREGEEVLEPSPSRHRLSDAASAAIATRILQGVIEHGTGKAVKNYGIQGSLAGKTGTTDDERDAWFVGFGPHAVVAVWVGRDRGTLGLSGAEAALPIWARYMRDSGAAQGSFPLPKGVEDRTVCLDSHRLSREACERTYTERFRAAHVPEERCDLHGGPVVVAVKPARPQAPAEEAQAPEETPSEGGFFGRIFGRGKAE